MATDSTAGGKVRPYRWRELDFEDVASDREFGVGAEPGGAAPVQPPAAEARTDEQCQQLLSEARQQAEALLAEAQQGAEEIREAARREGQEAGQREARAELDQQVARLAQLMEELAGYKDSLYREARQQVVELLLALLQKLVGPVLEEHPEALVQVVAHSLQLLSDRENLTIRVHPGELKLMMDAKPQLLEAFDGIQRLTILEDPSVKTGGCLVQTPTTEIDARLETRLQEIARLIRNP